MEKNLSSAVFKSTKSTIITFCFLFWATGSVHGQFIEELRGTQLLTTTVRTGDTEIIVIDPVFGDAVNASKAPLSEERYPIWMPSGKQIVFTSNREDHKTFNLYIANADGTNPVKLTKETEGAVFYFPSVQADGKKIWFSLAKGDKAVIGYVTPDGKTYEEIANGRDGAISPDGKLIAFTKQTAKGYPVFVMSSDGSDVKQITLQENEIGAVAPSWSPDGKRILYAAQVGEFLEIFSCSRDGSEIKQLTSLGKFSSSGAWSADGEFISFRVTDIAYWRDSQTREKAYQDKTPDKRPVFMMRADGRDLQLIETLHYQCGIDGSRAMWKPK